MAKPMGGLELLIGSPKKGMGKSRPMPSADEGDDTGETDEPSGGEEERAVRDFFEMGKAGDYKGATAAFRRAYDACAAGGHEEPDIDDEA